MSTRWLMLGMFPKQDLWVTNASYTFEEVMEIVPNSLPVCPLAHIQAADVDAALEIHRGTFPPRY